MSRNLLARVSTITIAVAAITHANTATAQDVKAPVADSVGVADIVVTAQKREQRLQDVPISISVVSGKQLAQFQTRDLKDLSASIPNLYVERLNAADVIYIRGFGSAPSNFAFDQSVSLYQDGIYAGRGKQFEAPFFDIERVEVLRGPQGALFGKNTPAGAISIVTAGPTRTFHIGGTLLYNIDLKGVEASGYVSGPLSDTVSVRLAVKGLDLDGYVPNRTTGKDDPRRKQGLARFSLRYEPTDDIDFTLRAEHSENETRGANIVLASTTVPGLVTKDRFADGNPFGFAEAENVNSDNVALTGNYHFGDGFTLTSITGYSTYKANRSNSYSRDVPAVYLNRILEDFQQVSQEVRLVSPSARRFSYIVGGYFDWSDYDLVYPKYYNLPSGVQGSIHSDFKQTARTYSVFGQGTFNLLSTLRVVGSVRYTRTEKTGYFQTFLDSGTALGKLTRADGKIGEGIVDPSATVQFDLTPDIMMYATYARGSKSGGFVSNTVGTIDSTFIFKPERSTNYEAGIKSSFFDRRVVLDLAVYNLEFTNLQTSVYDPTLSPPAFVTKNAAKASSKGVEASITWKPLPQLQLSWSGAYQVAKYNDFPGANCLARQAPSVCTPGLPASAPNSPANNNLGGYPLTFASKWSGSAQIGYDLPIGDKYHFVTTGILNYRSRYYNSDDQSLVYGVQKGYAKVDLRMQFGDNDDRWHVAVIGKNLSNERTYSFAFIWPASLSNFPTAHKVLDDTRTVAIEAGWHF